MKFIPLLLITFLLISCTANREVAQKNKEFLQSVNCPEGGDCTFEVLKNSSLEIKSDAFGKIYPEVVHGENLVIKYHYKKDEVKNTADSSYSEFLYFEINENEKQLILNDHELQRVKMLFGRICFCRGSMGYFKITKGNLFIFNNNGELTINSKFNVKKVPQITTEINEKIKYK